MLFFRELSCLPALASESHIHMTLREPWGLYLIPLVCVYELLIVNEFYRVILEMLIQKDRSLSGESRPVNLQILKV